MKKLGSALLGIIVLCSLLCIFNFNLNRNTSGAREKEKVLNIFNWGDYI